MSEKPRKLSPEEKLWAVKEYLSGKGSTYSVAAKYGVTDTSIRRWVDRYRNEGERAFQKKSFTSSLSPEEKISAVHKCLDGKLSLRDVALKYGVCETSVRKWIAKYEVGGDASLLPSCTKKRYSTALKQEVVKAYLAGEGSYYDLCIRYKIPSFNTIGKWVMQYNNGRNIQGPETGGTAIMKQGRKTTFEEKIEIVSFCIENHKNYQLTAETYSISYQQVYSWVKKYESRGTEALIDQRGRIKPENEMTELEKLRAENRILRAQNKHHEMEMAFLKKIDEIERRRG
jgi:transposase-like protein